MKGVIAFVLCLSVASCAVLKFDEYQQQWQAWKTFYGKQYKTDTEEGARYAIWRDNLKVCKCFKTRAITSSHGRVDFGCPCGDDVHFVTRNSVTVLRLRICSVSLWLQDQRTRKMN